MPNGSPRKAEAVNDERPTANELAWQCADLRDEAGYRCPHCDGTTVYQMFSGGREWYCEVCDTTGEYDLTQPRIPQATLLQTEAGRVALRAQMDQELARRRPIAAVCVHDDGWEHPSDGSLPCSLERPS